MASSAISSVYESDGNPRNTSPTSYEPKELATKELATKELATISGSSLEDIYQFFDVQREFGEQDQQVQLLKK